MKIDIIIPNYNGSALVKKNLKFVIDSLKTYPQSNIIIVDDGSDQEEKIKLKEVLGKTNEKKIQTIFLERNSGFTSAVNAGIKKSNADLVALLNTDVRPEKDFLKPVIKRFEKNKTLFAVGCMDKSIEDEGTVLRGKGIAEFKKGMIIHRKGEVTNDKTFWVSGGSSVLKRDICIKLGLFDQLYNPFYWEDIDLSYRAQKSGYDVVFERESVVTHIHSEGAIKTHFDKKKIKTIAYRNQLIFIWKNITDTSLILSHIFYLPYYITRSIASKDILFLTGMYLAIKKIPAIIAKRKKQKKYFTKPDKLIFSQSQ